MNADKFNFDLDNMDKSFPTHLLHELLEKLPTPDEYGKADPKRVQAILEQMLPPDKRDLARLVWDAQARSTFERDRILTPLDMALKAYVKGTRVLTAEEMVALITGSFVAAAHPYPANSPAIGRTLIQVLHMYSGIIAEIGYRNAIMSWHLTKEDYENEIWVQMPGFLDGVMISNMGRVRGPGGFPGLIYYAPALDAEQNTMLHGAYLATPMFWWDQYHPAPNMMALRIEWLQERAFKEHPQYSNKFPSRPKPVIGKRWKRRWVHKTDSDYLFPQFDCRMDHWGLEWYLEDVDPDYPKPRNNYLLNLELPEITYAQWAQANPTFEFVYRQMVKNELEQRAEYERLKKKLGEEDD